MAKESIEKRDGKMEEYLRHESVLQSFVSCRSAVHVLLSPPCSALLHFIILLCVWWQGVTYITANPPLLRRSSCTVTSFATGPRLQRQLNRSRNTRRIHTAVVRATDLGFLSIFSAHGCASTMLSDATSPCPLLSLLGLY